MKHTVVLESGRGDYITPNTVLEAVREVAPIALDPAGHPHSKVDAWHNFYGPDFSHICGLTTAWNFIPSWTTVYNNPPYGPGLWKWCEKMTYEGERGVQIHGLIPARVGTRYWEKYVWPSVNAMCFWAGRITFIDPVTNMKLETGGTFDAAVLYWGNRRVKFKRAFDKHGEVVLRK